MLIKLLNGQISKYPYQWSDFMADNNNTQGLNLANLLTIFPQTDMAKQGYSIVEVVVVPKPIYNQITQDCVEGIPVLVNGVWTQTWNVTTATAAEQTSRTTAQWQAYQAQAIQALSKSDSTMQRVIEGVSLGACALTNADVVAYMNMRKALRVILSEAQPATIPTSLPTAPFPVGT
jgi:hypothetical protein